LWTSLCRRADDLPQGCDGCPRRIRDQGVGRGGVLRVAAALDGDDDRAAGMSLRSPSSPAPNPRYRPRSGRQRRP
jgi:hypothetical protein